MLLLTCGKVFYLKKVKSCLDKFLGLDWLGSEEENVKVLESFGLTSCQARIYLALINCGISTTKTISIVSKMAREEVYQFLPKMHSLGLIEKILERPAKFKAIPLDECVSNLIEKRKNTTRELEIKSKELIRNYEGINSIQKNYPHEPKLVFVPSQQALIRKLKTSINGSQNSIWISTSCKRLTYACDHFHEVLQKAWDRGVKGRAIINSPKENHLDIINRCWISPWAEIRYIPKVPRTVITLYDKREVFVFTKPEADLRESPALWSNYPSIVSMAHDFFEILWSTSMGTPQYYLDSL